MNFILNGKRAFTFTFAAQDEDGVAEVETPWGILAIQVISSRGSNGRDSEAMARTALDALGREQLFISTQLGTSGWSRWEDPVNHVTLGIYDATRLDGDSAIVTITATET